jgi:hypothetical protein
VLVAEDNFVWALAAFVPPVVAAIVAWGMWRWAKRDEAEHANGEDDR